MMHSCMLVVAALLLSVNANEICTQKYQMIGCFQEDSPGKMLLEQELVIDWQNLKTFLSRISCKCAEVAKKQGYAGFAMHYGGECFGRAKTQIETLMSKEHTDNKCYGDQKYVDCSKEEHSHCMGKENAEAVYQFLETGVENVDGGYGEWLPWTECDKECGDGFVYRERTCDNPPPQGEGKDCSGLGPYTERKPCKVKECPINGAWSDYGSYGPCSRPCGGGVQYRHRNCTNPAPAYGGACCAGYTSEAKVCNIQPCPVDGGWSPYGQYGPCNRQCGGGNKTRHRSCNNPLPEHGGKDCLGPVAESVPCNTGACPAIHLCSVAYTTFQTHGGGNMLFLDRQSVHCANGTLSMIHLERNGENIRYQYKCCKIAGQGVCSSRQGASLFSEDGSGDARYLDRHAVDCGSSAFVSEFRVERNPAGNKVRYNYKCCQLAAKWADLSQCYTGNTAFTYDGNGRVYYLDRQTVSCNAGYALSFFQLQRNTNGNQYRYMYRCCKVNI